MESGSRGRFVLLIEDEANAREALAELLTESGFAVVACANASDALDLIGREVPDIVLTDLKMGTTDGLAVLRKTREVSPLTEVIVMTAYGTIEGAVAAMRQGAADFVTKPLDLDQLEVVIDRTLARRDLVRDHEIFGVEIARDILERHRPAGVDIAAVLAIIDGHDTTNDARSVNDAVMKDADKGWRCTPHGMRIIAGWYGWSRAELIDMLETVSNPRMLTSAGRALAEGLTAAVKAELLLPHYLDVDIDA